MAEAAEFQQDVLKHLDSLYSYALVLTRRQDDAEELIQESLSRAFEAFATFDRSLSFKAWMFAILRNAQIDRQRRWRTRHPAEPFADLDEVESAVPMESPLYSIPLAPEDILVRQETIEHVREAIRRLPPLMREVVELRDVEGLTYQEIARIVDRPVGTVMSRLYRGRNLLRTFLVEPGRQDTRGTVLRHDV